MIFGNASWGFRETPLEEQFEITAEMGLTQLELGIANAPGDIPLDVSDEEIKRIKEMALKSGVKTDCAATGNDFTTGRTDVEKVKRVIDICRKTGVKYLRIFAGFTALEDMTDERFEDMINALSEVCKYAEEEEIIPAIETHGGVKCYDDGVEHFMSTTTDIETLKRIMALLPDSTGICYDPANLYAVGIKRPEVFYNEIKNKVAYAHFKDFREMPSGHLKPTHCGDSSMDWEAVLKGIGERDIITLFEYENTEDIKEGSIRSYDYIRQGIMTYTNIR